MKNRHRLEKIFQSVFGDHDDVDNSKPLPNKEDMDKTVERMLKILRAMESGAISSDKSELVSLVDNLHSGYQAVQGRYDHLMGKLKRKIRPRSSDNGGFSIDFISSDSESSESSDSGPEDFEKKEKLSKAQEGDAEHVSLEHHHNLRKQLDEMKIRNNELETMAIRISAKLKEEQTFAAEFAQRVKVLQAEIGLLRKELEDSLEREDDTNQKMRSLHEENESLRSENAEAFIRIQEADKSTEEFQIELDQIKDNMETVKSENSILKEKLEITSKEVSTLNQQLVSATEEKEALRSGNFVFLKRIQKAEKSLAAFGEQADQKLKSVTEELKLQNGNLSSENESLKLRLEAAREELGSLKAEIQSLSSLIQVAEKTIGDRTTETAYLRDENLKLLNINNDLNQQLKVKVIENEALTSERLEAVEVNSMLSVEIEVLKDQNSKLLVDYETTMRELGETNDRVAELKLAMESKEDKMQSLMKENSALLNKIQHAEKSIVDLKSETEKQVNYNSQLQTKISDLGSELEETKSNLCDLYKEFTAAEAEKNALGLEISGLMIKLQEVEINKNELENEAKCLREEISMLQQNHDMELLEAEKIIDDFKVENFQLKANVSALGLELEACNLQLTNLNKTLVTAEEEKKMLASENHIIISKLQQAETTVRKLENDVTQMREENSMLQQNESKLQEAERITDELRDEIKQLRDENSKLQIKIEDLSLELEAANFQLIDLKKLIVAAEEERTSLNSEIVTMKMELQKAVINVQTLEAGMVKLQEENFMLEHNQDELKCQKFELEERLEEKEKEIRKLEGSHNELLEKLEVVEAEKTSLTSEIETVKGELQRVDLNVQTLGTELGKLHEENSMLKHNQNELQCHKIDLEGKFDEMEKLRGSFERKLEEKEIEMDELEVNCKELLEKLVLTEVEKASMASEIALMKDELEAELEKLQEENTNLEHDQNELCRQKVDLEEKIEEKEKEIRGLEKNCKELLEKLKRAKAEKAAVDRENEKLNKLVQRLELQHCLSNQKLRISETENKAKQEAYTKMVEEWNEERSVVEEQMLKLSRKINFLESNARRLKEVYKIGVLALANRYQELESVVQESIDTFLKQVSMFNRELKVLKKQVIELNNEKQDLSVKLKYKEEIISTMKDESECVRQKLARKDKEISLFKAYSIESEERMKVLEEMLRGKKKELSDKDEAKREVIRQLCLLIEYHRENCNHLYEYLSATHRRCGRSS